MDEDHKMELILICLEERGILSAISVYGGLQRVGPLHIIIMIFFFLNYSNVAASTLITFPQPQFLIYVQCNINMALSVDFSNLNMTFPLSVKCGFISK